MSLESDIAALGKVPLFADLTRDQLRLLAFGADRRRLREGEFVFREAAHADAGFVILEGTVALTRGREPKIRFLGRYGPGTLLGEMALICETRRPANARTETPAELVRIPRQLFLRLLEEYPEFAAAIHARLATDLLKLTQEIAAIEDRFRD